MNRLIGLETEYGLYIEGRGASDQMTEAMEFIRAFPGPHVAGWDYRYENPRRDARGWTAERLRHDPADARFDRPISIPDDQVKSDRVLLNGARLYNDHGHPEYSTPECITLTELVAHDKAGERAVLACARAYAEATGRSAHVYKNNTDYQGASYGVHENYLALREVAFERYAEALLTFLPTRVVYAGAGKTGLSHQPPFQIGQRADVFGEEIGIDTLYRRPIVNTRDEPHADPARWRRLHVIAGDANLSQYATALKVGTTTLLLDLVEDGWRPEMRLARPLEAIRHISQDDTYRWIVELDGGGTAGATDVQRSFLAEAARRYRGRDPQADWVLAEWEAVLDGLEKDPFSLADRLDWPAKLNVLRAYLDAEGAEWGSDRLVAADLEYHNIAPEEGLFACLEAEGEVVTLVSEERIRAAGTEPPKDTRASVRGMAVGRFGEVLEGATWGGFALRDERGTDAVDLRLLVGKPVEELTAELKDAGSAARFAAIVGRYTK